MTDVRFSIENNVLRKEQQGVSFVVNGNDGKAGELVVSRGGLRWFPKHKKKTNLKLTWTQFQKLIVENGKKET